MILKNIVNEYLYNDLKKYCQFKNYIFFQLSFLQNLFLFSI